MDVSIDEMEKVRGLYAELGKDLERERIISIIENAIIDSEGYCHADTVIAAIKGEN